MHATKSRALGVAAIATALLTLLVISVLWYQDWKQYDVAYSRIRETRRILTLNQALIDGLRDAETGQRGFLLTGRSEYLDPYRAALNQLPAQTSELGSLLNQDPDRRSLFLQLQSLTAAKLDELRTSVELRQSQQTAAALALVQSGQGKQTMDRLRQVSGQIQEAETARWQAAWDDLRSGAQHLRIVIFIGALLLAALVGLGGTALRSAAGQLEQSAAQLDQSRRAAEQNSDLLRATLYSIGDGVITTDRDGGVHMMNAVAERLTGYTEPEARGTGIERIVNIVNQATRAVVENPIRRVLKDGQVVGLANHTVLISKSGAEIPIDDSAAPIKGLSGDITGVVLVFRDVSERRKTFDTARRLASIVENSDDAIVAESLRRYRHRLEPRRRAPLWVFGRRNHWKPHLSHHSARSDG